MKGGQPASPEDAFARALDDVRSRFSCPAAIAVAYSGGLDSAALLHLASAYARSRSVSLFAFHVHHGLSANADHWLEHCRNECAALGVAFDAARVRLTRVGDHGVEAAARHARYSALGDMCRTHGVRLLLTAHHRDDQAETILLQLLRGAGVAGISGMEEANASPALLGDAELVVARPLLTCTRAQLAEFAARENLRYVEDESNDDPRYARNALRHRVMPVIERHFPGFSQRLVRASAHARSAQRLLDELAAQDLQQCSDGESVDLHRLQAFSADRIDNLLRYWLSSRGVRMPSSAWLAQMREQLFAAREDARVCVTHADCNVHRYRDRVYLTPRRTDAPDWAVEAVQGFCWNGEPSMQFASFRGTLHFEAAEAGIDPGWLRRQALQLCLRRGGEMLKPAPNRPSRSLKHHYQALGIPAWERAQLPLLLAEGKLLFAAGIGMNWRVLRPGASSGIRLRWEWNAAPDFRRN